MAKVAAEVQGKEAIAAIAAGLAKVADDDPQREARAFEIAQRKSL